MKKIMCLAISVLIVISISTMAVFAESNYNGKISEELQTALDIRSDEDFVKVLVEFSYVIDEEAEAEINEMTIKKCGYALTETSTEAQKRAYNATYKEYKSEYCENENAKILESFEISEPFISYVSAVIVDTTKAKVIEMAESQLVLSIDYKGKIIVPDEGHMFEDRYISKQEQIISDLYTYDEIEYHYSAQGDIQWVLVYAMNEYPAPLSTYVVLKDRVVCYGYYYSPATLYSVYDVVKDEFYDISTIEWLDYEGLEQAIEKQEIGVPIGDSDFDRKLTVMDATFVQRVIAELDEFNNYDNISDYYVPRGKEILKYISDFDRDGERTILDATAIQMKLAKVENIATTE